jgi:alpha-glucosidase (family GH31 glycosyl hydrolase)
MPGQKLTLKILKVTLLSAFLLMLLYYFCFELTFRGRPFSKQRHGNPPLTPAWALECWLWEDDSNTSGRVDTLLAGYAENDIPVRTILLDSPWSLRYNDFIIDTIRYPDPEKWFSGLQDNGYRIVLWMTSMVNSESGDTRIKDSESWFNEACNNSYIAGNNAPVKWWKGKGGFIDYTNENAMRWWHGLQQQVFNYGIDGWKLDGTATLFSTMAGPIPLFFRRTGSGLMTTRKYMDHYYRDEYSHGLKENPEFITLARSIDRWFHPEGFAPVDAAPVTWVGDQKHTWKVSDEKSSATDLAFRGDGKDGIELAMKNILAAARLGYNIIGSDVAGFSGREIPPGLYIRWTEFSTFCGLFLNGGHGERALWKRSRQELEIIRKFSWLHTELIPYIYSYVVTAHNGGLVLQRPVSGKYHYLFGENILIAPVYQDNLMNRVTLPEGRWRYLFDDKTVIEGPSVFEREFPLDEYPVYIREGAIIPMDIKRDYTGIGDKNSEGYLTLLIYPEGKNEFTVYHPDKSGSTKIVLEDSKDVVKINLAGSHKPHILNINMTSSPRQIELDGKELSDSSRVHFDQQRNKLIIKTFKYETGNYIIHKYTP